MRFPFDNSFFKQMEGFYAHAMPEAAPAPKMLAFNHHLAKDLGLPEADEGEWARWLSGAEVPEGADPIAFAYAGHQFGHFSPQLGDGRASLLGEILTSDGQRVDMQLKGSGRTPFSRNGDGKAGIGPVLREYLVSEAMAAMGIPTSLSLAAVATGEKVQRERAHPGAVLTRIASSHFRVGSFQYFSAHYGLPHLQQLLDYVIARHDPDLADHPTSALALLDRVMDRQAALIAGWMAIGFVHGVMNTDNMSISGETIDYGPCAFIDHFQANAVFSSIDRNGRYAYAQQPHILHWNMARFTEALLPIIHEQDADGVEAAKKLVDEVPARFQREWEKRLRAKLGLSEARAGDRALFEDLFQQMEQRRVDFTGFFRSLADWLRGDQAALAGFEGSEWDEWLQQWDLRLNQDFGSEAKTARADAMDLINPIYIPRNHLLETALEKAEAGDLSEWQALLLVVQNPYQRRAEWNRFADPASLDSPAYRTFCGT